MRTKTAKLRVTFAAIVVASLTVSVGEVSAGSEGGHPPVKIVVDPHAELGEINPLLFGANHRWPYSGLGMWDADRDEVYPAFLQQTREIGLTVVRYPAGTFGNTFHWKRAIGPQDEREDQLSGASSNPMPVDSVYGPDEHGRYLDELGAAGNIVVNFADGTAEEAADWVEYMTAEVGENPNGGTDWAAVRAANGHEAPYDIPYWELGNEINFTNQRYWLDGEPTARDGNCTSWDCRYAFGGYGKFTDQGVGDVTDFRPEASRSDGTANQLFHVRYTPVVTGTATVYVDGVAWDWVEELGAGGAIYHLDEESGRIRFGDGTTGDVPPDGARISITYETGPHDGYVEYFREMKRVNPDIKVCSSIDTDFFLREVPDYDCVVSHPYIGSRPGQGEVPNTLPVDQYHPVLMLASEFRVRNAVATLQQRVSRFSDSAEVIITEYGHLANSDPADGNRFHLSLSEGLLTANILRNFAELDVPLAQRHSLIDYVFAPPPEDLGVGLRDNAIISGPGPDTVPQAQAHVLGLFREMTGSSRVASTVLNNPTEVVEGGRGMPFPSLTTLASTDDDGNLYLIVINQHGQDDVTAEVLPQRFLYRGEVDVLTVNGPDIRSFNTPDDPDAVTIARTHPSLDEPQFDYRFPAHSVTAFRFTPVPGGLTPSAELSLTDDAPLHAEPGRQVTATFEVTNDGSRHAAGPFEAVTPAGWESQLPDSFSVPAGATDTFTMNLRLPDDITAGTYEAAAIAYQYGQVSDVLPIDVTVTRPSEPVFTDTFDDDAVGAPPAGYTVTGPEDAVLVTDTDDGRRAMAVQRSSPGSQLITAIRSFEPVSGDLQMTWRVRAAQFGTGLGMHLLDAGGQPVAQIGLGAPGIVAYNDGGRWVQSPVAYEARRWHDVQVTLDQSTDTYELRLDDQLVTAAAAVQRPAGTAERVRLQIIPAFSAASRFEFDEIRGAQLGD